MIKRFFNYTDKVATNWDGQYSAFDSFVAKLTLIVLIITILASGLIAFVILIRTVSWFVIPIVGCTSIIYSFVKFLKASKND